MKRTLTTFMVAAFAVAMMAVPAKRGQWKTIQLADGTEVRATLVGDEHGHFWKGEDGKAYQLVGDVYQEADAQTIVEQAKVRRKLVNAQRVKRLPANRRRVGEVGNYTGKKRAIMLLVNFSDKKMATGHDNALFTKIANQENYNESGFKGSMADYFKAQSRGQFELEFDVVGPLTVSNKQSYYGSNDSQGNDKYPGKMVCEAVALAKQQVTDWSPYDWDNDGYIDQVYVVYAGQGEADGGAETTIWPHAYDLRSAKAYGDGTGPVTVGTGLVVNSYACGSELNGSNKIEGIGTMCHEYSHCLGYPDFYDIDYSGGQGMGPWDLMDSGSYNDDGYQPAGYTSYERWVAGWMTPIELDAEDVNVADMKSLQNDGECYIIYNKANKNEYMLLENRQFEGWDASLPARGLLILHCDYDAGVWEANGPNDDPNHQRMTVVPADGKYTRKYDYSYQMYYYESADIAKDPFPQGSVNAFNKNFKTYDNIAKNAAQFFTTNSNSTKWIEGSVENIKQNSDKTVSFNYVASTSSSVEPGGGDDSEPVVTPDGALFYESFDKCKGTGGNDNQWSGNVATSSLLTDNSGWTSGSNKAYGGYQCAKFGASGRNAANGSATTPAIALNGTATLAFRAGAWSGTKDGDMLNLSVSNGGTISESSVSLNKGEFADYKLTVTGNGSIKITFAATKGRFFLDEVIVKIPSTTAIQTVTTTATAAPKTGIYTLDGRYMGNEHTTLARGLYIVNGIKVVIK